MVDRKEWIVTTSGDRPLKAVAKDLKKKGFKIDQVLDEVGSITGTGEDDVAEKVREVPGVTDVSSNVPIDIGPPDADETW
jgi:hypothetical protein